MKVLFVYEWCLIGGVEAFMASLASALMARGHQCEFFFFNRGPMADHLPAGLVHFGDLTDCIRLVRSRRYDIVHANSSDLRNGIAAVREVGARLVITAHGMVVAGWNSATTDALVCCSRWQTREQTPLTDLTIETIYNGIDLNTFKPARAPVEGPPIVGWIGRGADMVHKRIDTFAAAAEVLCRHGVRIRVADPDGPEEVVKVAPKAAETLRSVSEFWGRVAKSDLPAFYQQIAASGGCVVSTSVREGFGLALVEAQACGCPIVGPNVRGVNEVVAPDAGILYPAVSTPPEIASLVLECLSDAASLSRRRDTSVRWVAEHFNLDTMTTRYIQVYERTLRNRSLSAWSFRIRYWLAPLLNWQAYVEGRWTAGRCHYEASRKFLSEGDASLAWITARLALITCPSLYLKPRRLAHLTRTFARALPFLWRSPDVA